MTDEQIKQRSEEFILKEYSKVPALTKCAIAGIFVAGAHSRDEEIKELKKQLAAMTRLKNSFASGVDILDKDNRELQEELDKLRNPWISVKERLPEIEDEKEECTGEVFVCIKDGVYLVAHYSYFYKAWYAFDDRGGCMYRKIRTPRYWMPIPELKGGE